MNLQSIIWLHTITLAVWLPALNGLDSYHTLSKSTFRVQGLPNESYFGYSITYNNVLKSLVISSPAEDDIGQVYDCDINKQECVALNRITKRFDSKYAHKYWLGATVKGGPLFTVTCTPLHIMSSSSPVTGHNKGSFGRCYKWSNTTNLETMAPIIDEKRQQDIITRHGESKVKIEQLMDSFGWSIEVTSNNSVIVGGPAMYTGKGMVYNRQPTPKLFIRPPKSSEFPKFNFGYSVSSGYFLRDQFVYAVGSTFGQDGSGSVHFFNTDLKLVEELKKQVDTDKIGSMFGAVLCAAKIGNGGTDLLVGAPTYATDDCFNKGAVYVYLNDNSNMQYLRTIVGRMDASYFGSAMANVGDLNGDKKDEIAIAAPYEDDGKGAVYLYSGGDIFATKKGEDLKWLQRIESKKPEGIKGFGLSLTKLNDYDDNGCNELAVGAPYMDVVFLYRCFVSVTVALNADFPNVQSRNGTTNFNLTICLAVQYPEKPQEIIAMISTTVTMRHNSAKLSNPNDNGNFTFKTSLASKERVYCTQVEFALPPDGRYEQAITYDVKSKLLNNPNDLTDYDGRRVLLSDRSKLSLQESEWAMECADGKDCVPKLTLTFHDNIKVPYIIGSSAQEQFGFSLENTGDVAYEACLMVNVTNAPVRLHPKECQPMSTRADILKCAPKNPIRTTWKPDPIVLDMSALTNKISSINIDVLLLDKCKDTNKTVDYHHKIETKSNPDTISVKGTSNIEDAYIMSRKEITETTTSIQHKFTITNSGPTRWVQANCSIIVENNPYFDYKVVPGEDGPDIECTKLESNTICSIAEIVKESPVQISVSINMLSDDPNKIPKNENITIKSTFNLFLDGVVKTESITTLIQVRDAEVPLWIIIVACLFGLLLLFLIAFVLYECGFLRRDKKKELQNLRKSVIRQSIRRSRINAPLPDDDCMEILEQVPEEN